MAEASLAGPLMAAGTGVVTIVGASVAVAEGVGEVVVVMVDGDERVGVDVVVVAIGVVKEASEEVALRGVHAVKTGA